MVLKIKTQIEYLILFAIHSINYLQIKKNQGTSTSSARDIEKRVSDDARI